MSSATELRKALDRSEGVSLDAAVHQAAHVAVHAEHLFDDIVGTICEQIRKAQEEFAPGLPIPPHDIAHAQAEGLARYLVNDAMNSILDGEAPDAGRDEKIAPSELN